MFLKKMASLVTGLCVLLGAEVHAQDYDRVFILKGVAELRHVENAGQQPSGARQVSQQEWLGGLIAQGHLENNWAFFDSDYQLLDRRYSEFDRRNDQTIIGDSSLQFGRDSDRVYLELNHSSREIPILPLEGDNPNNRDQRTMVTARLNGNFRFGPNNQIKLWGEMTDTQFDFSAVNESQQAGVGMSYSRQISRLTQMGFTVTESELEYRYVDEILNSQRQSLWWRTQLRTLNYRMEVGTNTITSNLSESDGLFVDLGLTYDYGIHNVYLGARRWLADTSQGSGNAARFSRTVGQDGRLGVVDVYNRTDYVLSWTHKNPCSACRFKLDIGLENEDYERFSAFSTQENFIRAFFSRTVVRGVDFTVNGQVNTVRYKNSGEVDLPFDQEFLDQLEGQDRELDEVFRRENFTDVRMDIGLAFTDILRYGEFRFFVGGIQRTYDERDSIHSEFIGGSFRYVLAEL